MRSRFLVGAFVLASLAVGALAANAGSSRRWAIVQLQQPTQIGSAIAIGPVMFVHDDARMARGEPCTTVYRYDVARGPQEEIVSFHCVPRQTAVAETFLLTTESNLQLGLSGCRLKAYQFSGDSESHGVPTVP
jgi:hypothetical protein